MHHIVKQEYIRGLARVAIVVDISARTAARQKCKFHLRHVLVTAFFKLLAEKCFVYCAALLNIVDNAVIISTFFC